jgi:hypothetical protein
MKCLVSGLAFGAICAALSFGPAFAQPSDLQLSELQNDRIAVLYERPQHPRFQELYERLQKRRLLEELKAFLSPLRLPRKLTLTTRQCDDVNAFYDPGSKRLILCYEYVVFLETLTSRDTAPPDYTRVEAVAGGVVDAVLHEMGHALFDILETPIFGREEDAADQMAAFVMLQFSTDMARTAIKGGGYYYLVTDRQFTRTAFSDTHGADRQRYYNYLCLAHGADPVAFQDFVDKSLLPKARAVNCPREYEQVKRAFSKTILPYLDQGLMKKVQAIRWLRPEDGK